jgi:hypothetical protein
VYHADGGLLGEIRYVVGRLRGDTGCALCDISHAGLRMKASFRQSLKGIGTPSVLLHLNEQSPELAIYTKGQTPCVLAETGEGYHLLLSPRQLNDFSGDVARFEIALFEALQTLSSPVPPDDGSAQ